MAVCCVCGFWRALIDALLQSKKALLLLWAHWSVVMSRAADPKIHALDAAVRQTLASPGH
jgi:hypothetical protein